MLLLCVDVHFLVAVDSWEQIRMLRVYHLIINAYLLGFVRDGWHRRLR